MLTGVFIGLGIIVLSFLGALINMGRMVTGSVDHCIENRFASGFKCHLASMAGAFIGSITLLVCGIGFLIEKFAR